MLISSTATVNFRLRKNLLLIDCEIDGSVQPFIFDTGAPCVVLNKKYVKDDRLDDSGKKAHGATGEIADIKQTTIKHLSFGEIKKYNVT